MPSASPDAFTGKSLGVLLFDGAEELDFVGPWEMAAMWRDYAKGPRRLATISARSGRVKCAKGLVVEASDSFESLPDPDFLIVPGGFAAIELAKNNPETVEYVRRAAETADAILSICTGAFVLHAAGLLQGKRVATHWKARKQFAAMGGVACAEERWVQDGKVYSSGGVSAGIDMMLGFLSTTAGEDVASIVQLNAEYFPDSVIYGNRICAVHDAPAYLKELEERLR